MTWDDEPPSAIETSYAGHLFRSRLEARWAVAFDALGERWQYEPQGYTIKMPVGPAERYLPDFYLPDRRVWAEVKGSNDALVEAWQMLLTAAMPKIGLPADPDGSPVDRTGEVPRLLILGPVPRPTRNTVNRAGFILVGLVDGELAVRHCDLLGNSTLPVFTTRERDRPATVGHGLKLVDRTVDVVRDDKHAGALESARLDYALTWARAARFEYGEQPKVTPWRAGEEPPGLPNAAA